MRKTNLSLIFGLFALVLAPSVTRAAIFDAHDYIEPGKYSTGILGEFLLNNPSGEGLELRVKRGINDLVNIEPFVGIGRKNRGLRFGVATPISFFPNTEHQPGISLLMTGQYMRRETYRALQVSAAPIVHKVIAGMDHLPLNLFVAFPFQIEMFDGKYKTGWQMAFGGLYEIDREGTYFLTTEAALSLKQSESSVSIGAGIRFDPSGNGYKAVSWRSDEPKQDREKPQPNVKRADAVDESEKYEPEEDK